HRLFSFRGVVFDIDPEFANTEEWWQSIPAEVRPSKDQPFYHLFAENDETEYVAYVSEQNLLADTSGTPIRHPDVAETFEWDNGNYRPRDSRMHRVTGPGRGAAKIKRRGPKPAPFAFRDECRAYFFAGAAGAAGAAPCWPSSFLRASSAFFCNSSCSLRCCSSNAFG